MIGLHMLHLSSCMWWSNSLLWKFALESLCLAVWSLVPEIQECLISTHYNITALTLANQNGGFVFSISVHLMIHEDWSTLQQYLLIISQPLPIRRWGPSLVLSRSGTMCTGSILLHCCAIRHVTTIMIICCSQFTLLHHLCSHSQAP